MNPNEPPSKQVLKPTVAEIKRQRQARLEAAITPQGSGSSGWRERYTPPPDFPLQPCDFKKWARYDSLPIEQACFVLQGFEPPPLHVLRFAQDTYNPSREPTLDEPPGYRDDLRSLHLSIEHGNLAVRPITEHLYDTQHVSWPELVRWARSKSYSIPSELESIAAKLEPISRAVPKLMAKTLSPVPVVIESASDTVKPDKAAPGSDGAATPNWKMRIQTEATAHCLRLRKSGANPTVNSIVDSMARWCVDNGVNTDGGIHPSANYLRTHVLGSPHWNLPR